MLSDSHQSTCVGVGWSGTWIHLNPHVKSISNYYAFEVMHFRQIANPQMKMARLKSDDLQPLCKMPSPSSIKKAYLAGVDEEGVVDSSYRALHRPIVRCFVQTRARSWRRRTRDASPIARSGGGTKGNRAKGRKKPARWNRESHYLYLHSQTPLACIYAKFPPPNA